jgi:C-terminal processing protease CtpA/Prc
MQFAKNVEGTFTIMAVWNPSPAAKEGLKIGDRMLEVNRWDTHQMSLDDVLRHGPAHSGAASDRHCDANEWHTELLRRWSWDRR